jgi:hypothetical protein
LKVKWSLVDILLCWKYEYCTSKYHILILDFLSFFSLRHEIIPSSSSITHTQVLQIFLSVRFWTLLLWPRYIILPVTSDGHKSEEVGWEALIHIYSCLVSAVVCKYVINKRQAPFKSSLYNMALKTEKSACQEIDYSLLYTRLTYWWEKGRQFL